MGFSIVLTNVLITILYIVPGFLVCKVKKASTEHLSTLSAVLIYICAPCLIVSSFLSLDFSVVNLKNMGLFFVVTLVLQCLFMLIIYLIFKRKYYESKYRILTIGCIMGNVGFFGLPVIKSLLPNNPEVLCYSSIYTVSMNILVFTIGIFCLTRKKEYMTPKAALLNPASISLLLSLPCYLFELNRYLPSVLTDSIRLVGNMSAPLCMIILGIRLANISFKQLFLRPFVYLTCFGKLLLFPLFCYFAVYLFPFPFSFKASLLILSGTPCASIILAMSEMHRCEMELSANSVLLSTLICFLTVPLLTLIL